MNTIVCELIWTRLSLLNLADQSMHQNVPSFPSVPFFAFCFCCSFHPKEDCQSNGWGDCKWVGLMTVLAL